MGVSYKLTAMFSLAHGKGERLALWNLGLWNAGLIGLLVSVWARPSTLLVPGFACLLAVSAAIFVFDIGRVLRHRRRRRFSLDQWHGFVSLASFLVAAGMGVLLAAGRLPTTTWVVAYGWVALAGWFGFSIIGKYYKIVPFLIWLRRFSAVAGAAPTPLLRDLVNQRAGWVSFGLLTAGYAGVLAGVLGQSVPVLQVSGVLYALGAWLFAYNVARLLRSGTSTRKARSPAPQKAAS
ncbi:MAG: hypothetical protein ACREQM_22940, partial [Candidatus Dormibacteraceae bacterium]